MATVKALLSMRDDDGSRDDNMTKETWWESRVNAVKSWLDSNQNDFQRDGTLQLIESQLERGKFQPHLRRKCWKHIALEMTNLIGWDDVRSLPNLTYFKEGGLPPGEEPPPIPPTPECHAIDAASENVNGILKSSLSSSPSKLISCQSSPPLAPDLDTDVTGIVGSPALRIEATNLQQQESNPRPKDALQLIKSNAPEISLSEQPDPTKNLSQMTMLERQEYWMNKKKLSIELQRAEKEKENNSYSFKPFTGDSKRSFQAKESTRPTAIIPEAKPLGVRRSDHKSINRGNISSKWSVVREKSKNGEISTRKKGKPGGRTKKKIPEKVKYDANLPTAISVARASIQGLEEESTQIEADTGADRCSNCPKDPVGEPAQNEAANRSNDSTESNSFIEGSFWWKIEGGRGFHRVRDGSEFQMWSIYRKKDKSEGVKGVSILVGRMEEPPFEEKVIQMIWDIEEWTERNACCWWNENKHKYQPQNELSGGAAAEGGK